MQCKEMLYGLCCLQTNLHIPLHHQSDVLLHQGTTCEELILSSEIRNALGKSLQKVHLSSVQPDQKDNHMSCLPDVVPLLVTTCLYWGVHLTKNQPDQQADDMSC